MNKNLISKNQTEIGDVGIILTLANYINSGADIMVQTNKITNTVKELNFVCKETYFDNVPTAFFTEDNAEQLYEFVGQIDIDKTYINNEGDIEVMLASSEIISIERF